MPVVGYDVQIARKQLERVLASPGFAHNERLSRFLRFVVEKHLAGRPADIKESVIGVEVFRRSPDYDPKQDSIVRTEAARLRARLREYYVGDGKDDEWIIELPKGAYAPVFVQSERELASKPVDSEEQAPASGTRVRFAVALAGLAVGLTAIGCWWWLNGKRAPFTIAVLPLENVGHDPANAYLADGITDELIRNLSVIEGLAVRSRTSSFAFKAKSRDAREAGKQLGVDYLLEGSVLRVGHQIRIDVQLIRARDDFSLWSGRFDRELTDILAIQDEIAIGIANNLRLNLGRGRRRYETSTEAYDVYLRARAPDIRKGAFNEVISLFQKVIAKDPSFAPGYAGLAAAYAYRSGTVHSDPADLANMRSAAEKAIRLDPLLAEAHAALAMAYARDAEWRLSEKSFRRAIQLDPNRSASYADFVSDLLLVLSRTEEALKQLHIAERADPLSNEIQDRLARVLISAGRFEEAADHCMKLPVLAIQRSECLGRVRLGQGRISEAVQVLSTAVDRGVAPDTPIEGYLGYAYGRAGRRQEAEKLASAVSTNPFQQALTFAGLGDKDRTLRALERMESFGPVRLGRDLTYPEFALVRGHPRVKALRRKVGLPE